MTTSDNNNLTLEQARKLDAEDPLRSFRDEFIIPTKADLKSKKLHQQDNADSEASIYLCGNSLGCQPRSTIDSIQEFLKQWAMKGVHGHFTGHDDSEMAPFLDVDDAAAELLAPIVGASKLEVTAMETLTANLHFLMASFYQPTKAKCKIILEGKAFPSDHYAVYSQIKHHGFDPDEAMVLITPEGDRATITTEQILATIDKHAAETALVLLPGIQYYTGQLLDIKAITTHAHSHGLIIGWDLAHAVGNVELSLHDWDVDFAAWCTYKYLNAGPGAIGGLFVHEKHSKVSEAKDGSGKLEYRPRLSGWWGGDKGVRFDMGPKFVPRPGAAGFEVGNTSALAIAGLLPAIRITNKASMATIRKKSMSITQFLQDLLLAPRENDLPLPYKILTPLDPKERGAQLSIGLDMGLLDHVLSGLEDAGVVIDERKPDVIRVAPAPLYNTYEDCWKFVQIFRPLVFEAKSRSQNGTQDSTSKAM